MKFKCNICVDEGSSDEPCLLILKKAKYLKYDRDDWREALTRCPFESYEDGKYTGTSPVADWQRVKKK